VAEAALVGFLILILAGLERLRRTKSREIAERDRQRDEEADAVADLIEDEFRNWR
jgi:hypothetical protein